MTDDTSDRAQLIRDLYDLGAIELNPTRKTIGFERKPIRTDTLATDAGSGTYIGNPTTPEHPASR
jgi:hypothetical protein